MPSINPFQGLLVAPTQIARRRLVAQPAATCRFGQADKIDKAPSKPFFFGLGRNLSILGALLLAGGVGGAYLVEKHKLVESSWQVAIEQADLIGAMNAQAKAVPSFLAALKNPDPIWGTVLMASSIFGIKPKKQTMFWPSPWA